MSNLIEKILTNELVEASKVFEEKMDFIKQNKLFESKRLLAAEMHEGVGGLTNAEVEARKKAGYKKASDVLGDPREKSKSARVNPGAKIIKKKAVAEEQMDEATEKSTAGIRGALQSSDPEVAKKASKKLSLYRMAIGLRKGLGGKKAPKVSFMPKPTQQDVSTPSTPDDSKISKGYTRKALKGAGKAAGGIARTGLKLVGDFMSGLEEDVRPKKRMIVKKRKTILVTRKTDPHARMGGGVQRIDKDKYNPKIHNLAVEE